MPKRKAKRRSTNARSIGSDLVHELVPDIGERPATRRIISCPTENELDTSDLDAADTRNSIKKLTQWSSKSDVEQDPAGVALARKLQGSDLALQFAGLYIKNTLTSFEQYLDYLQIFSDTFKAVDAADRQLFSIFQISFDKIDQERSASGECLAGNLLRLWAYFDDRDLWYDLLNHSVAFFPPWFQELVHSEGSFSSAINLLQDYGFVHPNPVDFNDPESVGYSIEPLVQEWIANVLNQELFFHEPNRENTFAELALRLLASHIPGNHDSPHWFKRGQRLTKHGIRYLEYHDNIIGNIPEYVAWYNDIGRLFTAQVMPEEAMIMMRRTVQVLEDSDQLNSKQACDVLHNLGLACIDGGILKEAEGHFERAVGVARDLLGEGDERCIHSKMQLARVYAKQEKVDQAESAFRDSIASMNALPESNPRYVIYATNSLGCLYLNDSQYDKAILTLEQVRKMIDDTPVMWHEATAVYAASNLGLAYRRLGKSEDAERVLKWGLVRAKEIWPEDHPTSIGLLFSLARAYKEWGKTDMAQAHYECFLEFCNKGTPRDANEYFTGLLDLSRIYWDKGEVDQALKLYQRILDSFDDSFQRDGDFLELEQLLKSTRPSTTDSAATPGTKGKRIQEPLDEERGDPAATPKKRRRRRR